HHWHDRPASTAPACGRHCRPEPSSRKPSASYSSTASWLQEGAFVQAVSLIAPDLGACVRLAPYFRCFVIDVAANELGGVPDILQGFGDVLWIGIPIWGFHCQYGQLRDRNDLRKAVADQAIDISDRHAQGFRVVTGGYFRR